MSSCEAVLRHGIGLAKCYSQHANQGWVAANYM